MVVGADTSFLFSLYGNDAHSGRALAWLKDHSRPLHLTQLNEFELGNAFRFAEFKTFLKPGDAALYWENFQEDKDQGRLIVEHCNLSQVLEVAKGLSADWTLTGGHRSFDVLHVAAGLVLEASHFLTFDQNQQRLARKTGLNAPVIN
jgi:predicted nucleic acid-binding protein